MFIEWKRLPRTNEAYTEINEHDQNQIKKIFGWALEYTHLNAANLVYSSRETRLSVKALSLVFVPAHQGPQIKVEYLIPFFH